MFVCFSQGEVGEPGQKGSKADKGEQVCFAHTFTFMME